MDYIPFSAVASIYRIYCCAWEHDYSECNPPDIRCIYVFDCADIPRLFNDPDEFLEISLRKLFRDSSTLFIDSEIPKIRSRKHMGVPHPGIGIFPVFQGISI